ncbi:MAG: hypothetical protein IJ061_00115 [Lachnospiraceae bacterium]|nr:hypothetical protein [Lachnospiraceae bacterium]
MKNTDPEKGSLNCSHTKQHIKQKTNKQQGILLDGGSRNMNYYEVSTKCGHVGRGKYVIRTFPVIAEDGRQAAEKARYMPRVKHDHKDAILSVVLIDSERYEELRIINSQDPYLRCKNIQEQRANCIDLDLYDEPEKINYKKKNINTRKARAEIRNRKNKINYLAEYLK